MIVRVCRRYSRYFSPLTSLLSKSRSITLDCHAINLASGITEPQKRVAEFGRAAPNCCCELQTTSPYSPGTIKNEEQLTRFIFSPVHVNSKNGKVKPSAFSHISSMGCSVQREDVASTNELNNWLHSYLTKNNNHQWMGTLTSFTKTVREINPNNSENRVIAVYDTAEPNNLAHAELFQTEHVIEDADSIELRAELLKNFSNGILTKPTEYREGQLSHHA